jgi:AcrR family transcriptional regulator
VTEKRRRLRQEASRQRIIDAAIEVVGRHGYAKASIARIAEEAGIAYGSIYQHFENQHDLFTHLLPQVREQLLAAIRTRSAGARTFLEHETSGFDVLFEMSHSESPKQRVFSEAPFFIPKEYEDYLAEMAGSYIRALQKFRSKGEVFCIDEAEYEITAYILMGSKQFLIKKYADRAMGPSVLPAVRETYLGIVERAIYGEKAGRRA